MPNRIRGLFVCVTLFVLISVLAGCSTAGPFVTNISSDGKGNIVVEKNTVKYNSFTGTVSAGDTPTTMVIQVVPEEVLEAAKD